MTTYSISLDDVDLALLPLHSGTYNNFLKKEYFEFQIMKRDTVEEPKTTILYTCHICAIDVPAAFAREHAASIKHRANARIASVAAQRTSALISALPPPFADQPHALFCANCTTIVDKNHDKTKEHRVAVMHDKLLWELMTAYVGDHDDVTKTDNSEFHATDIDDRLLREETKENKEVYCNGYKELEVLNHIDTDSEMIEAYEKNQEVKSIKSDTNDISKEVKSNESDTNDKNKEVKNIKSVLNDKNKELKSIKSDTNDKNIIRKVDEKSNKDTDKNVDYNTIDSEIRTIESEKNELTKVFNDTIGEFKNIIERFNSVKKYQDNATAVTSKAAQEKVEYVEFVTKYNKLVKVHCDHYHSFVRREGRVECIVCSSTFNTDEANSHMFSLKHLNMLPSKMIDEHCVRKINDIYSHCILCNQVIKNTNVVKHLQTFSHGDREKHAVFDSAKNSQPMPAAKIGYKKPVNVNIKTNQTADDKVKVQVKNTIEEKAKMACSNAVKNASSKVIPNGSVEKPNVPGSGEVKLANLDWPVIYPYEATLQEGCVYCVICDCKVPNNPENRKSHLTGSNHAKNVKSRRVSLVSSFT